MGIFFVLTKYVIGLNYAILRSPNIQNLSFNSFIYLFSSLFCLIGSSNDFPRNEVVFEKEQW